MGFLFLENNHTIFIAVDLNYSLNYHKYSYLLTLKLRTKIVENSLTAKTKSSR